MAITSKHAHARPYVESPTLSRKLADIKTLLDTIRQLDIEPKLKRDMLVHGIWEVAKATGNFNGRYRSQSVIDRTGLTIQRDHIYKKKTLVDELLRPAPDLDMIIERARCCIVSVDEHQRLHGVGNDLDGWDRYRAAGVIVHDMLQQTRIA
jgi:hypothetical protein